MWEMLAASVGVSVDDLKKFVRLAKSVDWQNLFVLTDLYTAERQVPNPDGPETVTQTVEVDYDTARVLQQTPGWKLISKRAVCQLTWVGPNPKNVDERVRMVLYVPLLTPVTSVEDIEGGL